MSVHRVHGLVSLTASEEFQATRHIRLPAGTYTGWQTGTGEGARRFTLKLSTDQLRDIGEFAERGGDGLELDVTPHVTNGNLVVSRWTAPPTA